jgi:hypothetical protein
MIHVPIKCLMALRSVLFLWGILAGTVYCEDVVFQPNDDIEVIRVKASVYRDRYFRLLEAKEYLLAGDLAKLCAKESEKISDKAIKDKIHLDFENLTDVAYDMALMLEARREFDKTIGVTMERIDGATVFFKGIATPFKVGDMLPADTGQIMAINARDVYVRWHFRRKRFDFALSLSNEIK